MDTSWREPVLVLLFLYELDAAFSLALKPVFTKCIDSALVMREVLSLYGVTGMRKQTEGTSVSEAIIPNAVA